MVAPSSRTRVPEGMRLDLLEAGSSLYEVIQGEFVEIASSSFASWLAGQLSLHLAAWVKSHSLGIVVSHAVFIFDDERSNQPRPDIAFVSSNRWPIDRIPPDHDHWRLIPNLAVEVVTPTDCFEAVVGKVEMYLDSGVEEVWVVTPRNRTVMVFRQGNRLSVVHAGQSLSSPLFPGWTLSVDELIPTISST